MTRFEKIKAMSVEELVDFLDNVDKAGGYYEGACAECPHNPEFMLRGCFSEMADECRQAGVRYLMKEADE